LKVSQEQDAAPVIELHTHDIDRVFHLAVALATTSDEDEADLGECFAEALLVYQEFMASVADGKLRLGDEDADVELVSSRQTTATGDVIRFHPRAVVRPEKKKKHKDVEPAALEDRSEKKKKKK
jgi:hypothetical protein